MKKEIHWNSIETIPTNEEMIRKMVLLTSGRSDKTLSVIIDYWHVFLDERDMELSNIDKKVKLNGNEYSYCKFIEHKVPFDKIKGWMFADDLIELWE